MDEKGMLSRLRVPIALGTACEAKVLVRIEEKPELGWQITKLSCFLPAHLLGSKTDGIQFTLLVITTGTITLLIAGGDVRNESFGKRDFLNFTRGITRINDKAIDHN